MVLVRLAFIVIFAHKDMRQGYLQQANAEDNLLVWSAAEYQSGYPVVRPGSVRKRSTESQRAHGRVRS
jgi:hypothetical protein